MNAVPKRIVLDTNVVVSRALVPRSTPGRAVSRALSESTVLASTETMRELEAVLMREKFDRIGPLWKRRQALRVYFRELTVCETVAGVVTVCRDPKDNMLLDLALSGNADIVVTGDKDLLCLHPWRGIAILSPADYLALPSESPHQANLQ